MGMNIARVAIIKVLSEENFKDKYIHAIFKGQYKGQYKIYDTYFSKEIWMLSKKHGYALIEP